VLQKQAVSASTAAGRFYDEMPGELERARRDVVAQRQQRFDACSADNMPTTTAEQLAEQGTDTVPRTLPRKRSKRIRGGAAMPIDEHLLHRRRRHHRQRRHRVRTTMVERVCVCQWVRELGCCA
jgi:hypothetical protein